MSVIVKKPLGQLGNQMFTCFYAKILANKLGYSLKVPTESHHFELENFDLSTDENAKSFSEPIQYIGNENHTDIDYDEIISDKSDRCIVLNDYFQRKKYFVPYKDDIVKWCNILNFAPDKNDLGVHIRLGDIANNESLHQHLLPLDYYIEAIKSFDDIKTINVCTNPHSIHHEYIKTLRREFSIKVIELKPKQTMDFLAKHNRLILSQGAFSFWAGFLSNASCIVNAIPKTGWNSKENTKVDLLMDAPNYKNIEL